MVFPLLVSISLSIWWEFTKEGWDEKSRNSFQMPIFVICYSRWCPHCHGIPEAVREYADGAGNRSDYYLTLIDCANRGDDCSHFHITGTPYLVLVVGPNRKYWTRIRTRDAKEWDNWIDKFVKPSLREIKTDAELFEAKREPRNGGTTFHLETPTTDNDIMLQLANLSKEFRVYNDTFTFRINPNLTRPVLTAHVSPYCSVTWKDGTLREFLEEYRFGSRHEYNEDEYRLQSRRSKMSLLVVEEGLVSGQNYALEQMPKNFCHNVTFGWLPVKDSNDLLKEFKQNSSNLPFMVYTDPRSKCRAFNKGRTIEAETSGFLKMAMNGELCNQVFLNGLIQRKDGAFEQVAVTKSRKKMGIGGLCFSLIYIIGGLCLIIGIRMTSSDSGKQE